MPLRQSAEEEDEFGAGLDEEILEDATQETPTDDTSAADDDESDDSVDDEAEDADEFDEVSVLDLLREQGVEVGEDDDELTVLGRLTEQARGRGQLEQQLQELRAQVGERGAQQAVNQAVQQAQQLPDHMQLPFVQEFLQKQSKLAELRTALSRIPASGEFEHRLRRNEAGQLEVINPADTTAIREFREWQQAQQELIPQAIKSLPDLIVNEIASNPMVALLMQRAVQQVAGGLVSQQTAPMQQRAQEDAVFEQIRGWAVNGYTADGQAEWTPQGQAFNAAYQVAKAHGVPIPNAVRYALQVMQQMEPLLKQQAATPTAEDRKQKVRALKRKRAERVPGAGGSTAKPGREIPVAAKGRRLSLREKLMRDLKGIK